MTETTEHTIALDMKHRALRSGDRWALMQRDREGEWQTLETWAGNRRSLFHRLDQRGIVPSRDAEAQLALLPESQGFKERMP